jgi:LuxR family maltose regulon positive regulatory protein
MGELELATELLAKGQGFARGIQSRTLELLCELVSAWFKLRQQDDAAFSHLRRGLALQRAMGFLNIPGWRNSVMKPLLLLALENNIETAFVQQLIRKRGLCTDAPPQASEAWPWPVKIYTLGRFSLIIDGRPLQFSGKAQQKPLELLKTLIAFGGRGISKDRLTDTLWPDTDGDKAQRALDTTLHRIRKLVGHEQLIQVQNRKLSLNTQLCWIDVWALERLLGEVETLLDHTRDEHGQISVLQQQLISMYQGGFLSDDNEPDCIGAYREQLHHRCLHRLDLLGSFWEKQEEWDQALALYHHMLEMDDRQERTYQSLINCYRSKGLIAEAIAIYERCRAALATHHGILPSAQTEALYQSLR